MSTAMPLVEHFAAGLNAPICLTWELTYACNLACRHCLSSSGRRDPHELTTDEAKAVIDELEAMQVFYVNIGGGEPTIRSDFWEIVDYAVAQPGRREILDQRLAHHSRGRSAHRRQPLPRRADLPGRGDRRGQRRRARDGFVRHRRLGNGAPRRRRGRRLQALRRLHATQRVAGRRSEGAGRPIRRPVAADAAAPVGARSPTSGTNSTPPTSSSASCTAGCRRTANRC